ncbi:protein of unknown function [Aminobacter niigataensis]|nr:protein of unknown function [Aminobacter niigataensis]
MRMAGPGVGSQWAGRDGGRGAVKTNGDELACRDLSAGAALDIASKVNTRISSATERSGERAWHPPDPDSEGGEAFARLLEIA